MTKTATIKVDYHFHPNLPHDLALARTKVRDIYKRFTELGIRAVLVTEHVYKDYERAWELMCEGKPRNVHIYPGMEYVTSENIDVILFAKKDLYERRVLLPFERSYEEIADYVRDDDEVFGFVAHPFTLGRTSIMKKAGAEFEKKMCEEMGSVEAAYDVFADLKRALEKPVLRKLFCRTLHHIAENEHLPECCYPDKLQFLAVGSDAHYVWEIGTCAEVKLKHDDIFYSIVNNRDLKVVNGRKRGTKRQDLHSFSGSIREWLLKTMCHDH